MPGRTVALRQAKKEPRAVYALGVLFSCLNLGFWSDGVGVSGDGKMPPGRPYGAQIESGRANSMSRFVAIHLGNLI